jgi:dihydroorotase
MKLALKNGKAYIEGKLVKTNILCANGKIAEIGAKEFDAEHEIDCKGKIILPGAIDCHVHFRTPGFEYKEDWCSGSLAALHGGVTTVMDMPNNDPPIISATIFEKKRRIVEEESLVSFELYMGATENNLHEMEKAKGLHAVKLYFGHTTGNLLMNNPDAIRELFLLSRKKGFVVVAHAEDDKVVTENEKIFKNENWPETHVLIRNEKAEVSAIRTLLNIQNETGGHLHFAHVSSKGGLKLILQGKKLRFGNHITFEVSPNHLFLDSNDYKTLGNLIKCNPSIKGPEHRIALYSALKNGLIDVVATDHAPHTFEEKQLDYWQCPSGIPGIETMVPLLLNEVVEKKISLQNMIKVVSENPAKIFNLQNKGFIRKGFDADLIIIDLNKNTLIQNARLFTKAKYSPFDGMELKGCIEHVIARGNVYG